MAATTSTELNDDFSASIMDNQVTMNELLSFVKTNNYDLINTLTQTYLRISKSVLLIDTDDTSITFLDYYKKISNLIETKFSCIHRAVNTRTAEMFLINTLFYFYTKVYPNDLSKFETFVEYVVEFIVQQQDGYICIFDGSHEELPREFFVNLVTGSVIALSLLQSRKCRSIKTAIYKLGLKQGDPTLKELKRNYTNVCKFFKTIDTSSYEREIREKFNVPSSDKEGGGIDYKKTTTRKHKKTKRKHHKRRKTRSNLRKSKSKKTTRRIRKK